MAADVELLRRRRDRTIAVILGVKERECDPYLPAEVSAKLRKVILDTINTFYDDCLDVSRSDAGPGVVLNELYQQKLDSALEGVEEIRRLLGAA